MTCGLESRGTAPARNPVASDPLQFLGYTSYQAKSNFSKMRSKPVSGWLLASCLILGLSSACIALPQ